MMPAKNASGIDTMPGLVSGKMDQSALGNIAVGVPETAGESAMRTSAVTRPVYIEATAPVVLKRFQYSEYKMVGRLADAAMAKASETRKATFWLIARIPSTMETTPMTTTVMRETRTCSASVAVPSRSTAS